MEYRGRNALITGASSGIGEAFARELAARGMALLLTAYPAEEARLQAIGQELRDRHGVRVEVVPLDLSEREGAARLQAGADALGFEPDLLVNSAGLGAGGDFASAPLDRQLTMIHVNVEALVALCGLYLPRLAARRDGSIINIVSTSAFEPMPYMAVYAASKAFVLRFSEALWAENHRRGVRVVALCPGPVQTAFHQAAGAGEPGSGLRRGARRRYLTAEHVVEAGLNGLERDRPTVVRRAPGLAPLYYGATVVGRLAPRRLRLMTSERLNRWYFEQR
ncbi:MAG TPA: SDR family oxidoreductase [Thermomicrobiaceae bacterium]|nr:SDR family oxidoreductase [Thermomicrobiaceae bacterium]